MRTAQLAVPLQGFILWKLALELSTCWTCPELQVWLGSIGKKGISVYPAESFWMWSNTQVVFVTVCLGIFSSCYLGCTFFKHGWQHLMSRLWMVHCVHFPQKAALPWMEEITINVSMMTHISQLWCDFCSTSSVVLLLCLSWRLCTESLGRAQHFMEHFLHL